MMIDLRKPSATKRKIQKHKRRLKAQSTERDAKIDVRRRDRFCRFPLCGCRRLKLALEARGEVSHQRHKGMGGNPAGDRSTADLMIYLCKHRHQDGAVSRHKGTLQAVPLTSKGMDGPVKWLVDSSVLFPGLSYDRATRWFEVAREVAVQRIEPLSARQQIVLERLAEMNL